MYFDEHGPRRRPQASPARTLVLDDPGVPESDGTSDVYDTHYRLVVKNAPDYAIFTMDLEGIIRTWNPAAARIMGYSEAEIVGQTAALIFTAEDRAAGVPEREMRKARETGKAEDVRWHLRKDGSRFWANGIMTALNEDAAGAWV